MTMDRAAMRHLFPLADQHGLALWKRIVEHPAAPPFTHQVGDHVQAADLVAVQAFRDRLGTLPQTADQGPPAHIVEWVGSRYRKVPLWQARIARGFAWQRDWLRLPTMNREDLARRMTEIVPSDEPLERLIVYDTSGTTGHALRVPHHPRAVAQLHVLVEQALEWFGRTVPQGPDHVACMNLHAQASIWTYASLFSVWGQAGFARVNLNRRAWPRGPEHARRFVADLVPGFLCGNPHSFSELLCWQVEAQPAVLISTAVALSEPLKAELERHYRCPVLDWYSCTETGPLACSRPGSAGLALLAPDVYVELLDAAGNQVPEGQRGEITVTGGRNPYLPLTLATEEAIAA